VPALVVRRRASAAPDAAIKDHLDLGHPREGVFQIRVELRSIAGHDDDDARSRRSRFGR
jgi:hypothetical protein